LVNYSGAGTAACAGGGASGDEAGIEQQSVDPSCGKIGKKLATMYTNEIKDKLIESVRMFSIFGVEEK
jgi:hypothetical protein